MLATQGQLTGAVPHSLIVRTHDSGFRQVKDQFAEGKLVRMWPFRGTLHIVSAQDHHWLRALWTSRGANWWERESQLVGKDDSHVDHARSVTTEALTQEPRRRSELRELWDQEGVGKDLSPEARKRLYYLLFVDLHRNGTMAGGPISGSEHLLVDATILPKEPTGLAERIEAREPAAIRTAYAEVARRFALSHGPVSVDDLSWWAGATKSVAGRALEDAVNGEGTPLTPPDDAGLRLIRMSLSDKGLEPAPEFVPGVRYFYMRDDLGRLLDESRADAIRTFYLAAFDELHVAYRDRTCLTDAAGEKLICPGGNGMFRPLLVDRGRVVAVNPKNIGLQWQKQPTKRLERDVTRAITRIQSRLAR